MSMRLRVVAVLSSVLLAACGPPAPTGESVVDAGPEIVVMGDDLRELRDAFNANEGRVRLLFLSGPTCGICLRGMADLNDAFLADRQADDRLVTFVVHVPTMGASKQHALDSIRLLQGPRIHHYWEETGILGRHFSEVMDVDMYVWDFWAIYGSGAQWAGALPPVPDYYEHQLGATGGRLGSFPKERVLDAERFAATAFEYLAQVEEGRFASGEAPRRSESERLADGAIIPSVGQPRGVAIQQHIMGRGGYRRLKRIESIDARGHIVISGDTQELRIRSARDGSLRREIGSGERASVAQRNPAGTVSVPEGSHRGLPPEIERVLLEAFEFDGPLVEWPDKGHAVGMLGMRKFGDVLAWKLDLVQKDGPHWQLYMDSHTGDQIRAELLDDSGTPALVIEQDDFRETRGFRIPHRIEYYRGDGEMLATESIDEVTVYLLPEARQTAAGR